MVLLSYEVIRSIAFDISDLRREWFGPSLCHRFQPWSLFGWNDRRKEHLRVPMHGWMSEVAFCQQVVNDINSGLEIHGAHFSAKRWKEQRFARRETLRFSHSKYVVSTSAESYHADRISPEKSYDIQCWGGIFLGYVLLALKINYGLSRSWTSTNKGHL